MTKTIYKYVDGKWKPQDLTAWAMTEEYVVQTTYTFTNAQMEEWKKEAELIEKKENFSECKNTNS